MLVQKVLADISATKGRSLAVLLTLTLGLTALSAVLGAHGILTREVSRAYQATQPASATLELDRVTPEALRVVESHEDVAAVAARRTVHARFRTESNAPYQPVLLFVVDDFLDMPLATLGHERGAMSPPVGTILVERSALSILGGDVGTSVWIEVPGGQPARVSVSGVVHEPALAPAQTHQSLYAYANEETATLLGAPPGFDELRFRLTDQLNLEETETRARLFAQELQSQNVASVHSISVPPPGRHPHESQMRTVLALLLSFGALLLVMSSLVSAALLSSLLARQRREIAVMKTLGASSRQLTLAFALALGSLAGLAVLAAVPLGLLGAQTWARAVSVVLNFDPQSLTPPGWTFLVEILLGLLVPVIVALPGILRATRQTVVSALADYGAAPNPDHLATVPGWLSRLSPGALSGAYALRGLLRTRRQFTLSLALLSVAGGIFLGAANLRVAWGAWTRELTQTHQYDLEIATPTATDVEGLAARLRGQPGVAAVDAFQSATAALVRPGEVPVAHGYPDDAHGTLHLVAPPPQSEMVRLQLSEGRLARPEESDAIAINQMVEGAERMHIGDPLTVAVEGRPVTFRIVGKVSEVGVGALAHLSQAGLARFGETDSPQASNVQGLLRIRATADVAVPELARALDERLTTWGTAILAVTPLAVFQNAMVAHLEVLVGALTALSVLSGLVGALGLGATLGVQIALRGREFAVLRCLGALPGQIRRLVQMEGSLLALASLPLALGASVPFTWLIGNLVGRMSFRIPLPFTLSVPALIAWGLCTVCVGLVATWVPARLAARTTVKAGLNGL